MNTFYRYVTPSCVRAYELLGWDDLGPTAGHHGQWSNTMVIKGMFDEPPEPTGPLTANSSLPDSQDWDESAAPALRAERPAPNKRIASGKLTARKASDAESMDTHDEPD